MEINFVVDKIMLKIKKVLLQLFCNKIKKKTIFVTDIFKGPPKK